MQEPIGIRPGLLVEALNVQLPELECRSAFAAFNDPIFRNSGFRILPQFVPPIARNTVV